MNKNSLSKISLFVLSSLFLVLVLVGDVVAPCSGGSYSCLLLSPVGSGSCMPFSSFGCTWTGSSCQGSFNCASLTQTLCGSTSGSCSWSTGCTQTNGGVEICDGLDNNCAGGIDEGVSPTSQSCTNSNTYGTCSGTQTRVCNGLSGWGSWGSCNARTPIAEICGNGIDDDCTGGDATCPSTTSCSGIFNCLLSTQKTWCDQLANSGCSWYQVGSVFQCNNPVAGSGNCNFLSESLCNGLAPQCTWNGPVSCSSGACCVGGIIATVGTKCYTSTSVAYSCTDNIIYGTSATQYCNGVSSSCTGAIGSESFIRNYCDARYVSGSWNYPAYEAYYCADGPRSGPSADICDTSLTKCSDNVDNDNDGAKDCNDSECRFTDYISCTLGTGSCQSSGYRYRDCNTATGAWLATYGACFATPGTPTAEICGNGIDEDCSGYVDNGCPCTSAANICGTTSSGTISATGVCSAVVPAVPIWYRDLDGDGRYNNTQSVCIDPGAEWFASMTTSESPVCDRNAATSGIFAVAAEVCNGLDDDCNGVIDNGALPATWYFDLDLDGRGNVSRTLTQCSQPAGYVSVSEVAACDLNAGTSGIFAVGVEVCNGLDDDCNGVIDNGVIPTWYFDLDLDGRGNVSRTLTQCSQPAGYVSVSESPACDRNAGTVGIFAVAAEVCNGLDDDCNGVIDNGVLPTAWYRDLDGDSRGNSSWTVTQCSSPGAGWVSISEVPVCDRNAATSGIFAVGVEVCNGLDDDCNGVIDNGVLPATWYFDLDLDGRGNVSRTLTQCSQPAGYVSVSEVAACDRNAATVGIYAIGIESCNNLDDDCDGAINDNLANTNIGTACTTGLFGVCSAGTQYQYCNAGVTAWTWSTCSQTTAASGSETCDNLDNTCNGITDENCDDDNDNYCDSTMTVSGTPTTCTSLGGDCQDAVGSTGGVNNNLINPGRAEVCNGVNDNCDASNLIDEGFVFNTYYRDLDSDTFGNSTSGTTSYCALPVGYSTTNNDCNNNNNAIYPGAPELCNGIDDNCINGIDEIAPVWYRDADGDTFGSSASGTLTQCSQPAGYVSSNTDCNDANAAIKPTTVWYLDADTDNYYTGSGVTQCTAPSASYRYTGLTAGGDCADVVGSTGGVNNNLINPGRSEVCNGVDDNCVAGIDEGVRTNYYLDADTDNYYTGSDVAACSSPGAGYRTGLTNGGDCNDGTNLVYPGRAEICDVYDNDCDAPVTINEGLANINVGSSCTVIGQQGVCATGTRYQYCDFSVTTYTWSTCTQTVFPTAEICGDGLDNNCNGQTDETAGVWYRDLDGDGYGNITSGTLTQCTQPAGYVATNNDCKDTVGSTGGVNNNLINPGRAEVCNAVDDDCDNIADDGLTFNNYYRDLDGDTYGNTSNVLNACSLPVGYVSLTGDCNDGFASIRPGIAETCNGVDNNCNGMGDEGLITYYRNLDGDTYGNSTDGTIQNCSVQVGYSVNNGDCNNNNAAVYPGAVEVCDGIDNNCINGIADEAPLPWYRDLDGDTFGNITSGTLTQCTQPAGYVASNTDCKDTVGNTLGVNNNLIYPGALEVCDGVDNNCVGGIDEGVKTNFYLDTDNDNYYNGTNVTTCSSPGAGYRSSGLTAGGDCNNTNNTIYPTAPEICNGIDNNCVNGIADEAPTPWYRDFDVDGFGNVTVNLTQCAQPAGYVSNRTDCNDNDNTITLGYKWYRDFDLDTFGNVSNNLTQCIRPAGFVLNSTDCNDNNAGVTNTLTWYRDADNDTYGNSADNISSCLQPAGYVAYGGQFDCNDADPSVASDCACTIYIPYNMRIGFTESPSTFNVPVKPAVITAVCSADSISPALVKFSAVATNGALTVQSPVASPMIRSLNLPPCANSVSATRYCLELGYGITSVGTINSTSSGSCANYSGSWTTVASGTKITSMNCSYGGLLASDKLVFNTVDTDGSFKPIILNCTGSRIGVTTKRGADGICVDDFVAVPVCGFSGGLPVDPDCGNHTNVTCGYVRVLNVTTGLFQNQYSCTNYNPKQHRACVNSTDCVYNTTGQPLGCYGFGTMLFNGSYDIYGQQRNITCSLSNTWCPKGYTYNTALGYCEPAAGTTGCSLLACPSLNVYTQLPDYNILSGNSLYTFKDGECKIYNMTTRTYTSCSDYINSAGSSQTTSYTRTIDGMTCIDYLNGTRVCTTGSTQLTNCYYPPQINCTTTTYNSQLATNVSSGIGYQNRLSCSGTSATWSGCEAVACKSGFRYDSVSKNCVWESGSASLYCQNNTLSGLPQLPCYTDRGYGTTKGTCYNPFNPINEYIWIWSACTLEGCNSGFTFNSATRTCETAQPGTTYTYKISDGIKTEKIYISNQLGQLIKDNDCTVRTGTLIRGICVASQTSPEFKYTTQNVVVK